MRPTCTMCRAARPMWPTRRGSPSWSSMGWSAPASRSPRPVRELRELTRYRKTQTGERSREAPAAGQGHLLGRQPDGLGGRGGQGGLGHLLDPAVRQLGGHLAAQPAHQPPAPQGPERLGGLVAAHQHQSAAGGEVKAALQAGKAGLKQASQPVHGADPVGHQVPAVADQHGQLGDQLILGPGPQQVLAHPGRLGDDQCVLGVGLGFPGEGAGHPVDRPARHIDHRLVGGGQQPAPTRRCYRSNPPPSTPQPRWSSPGRSARRWPLGRWPPAATTPAARRRPPPRRGGRACRCRSPPTPDHGLAAADPPSPPCRSPRQGLGTRRQPHRQLLRQRRLAALNQRSRRQEDWAATPSWPHQQQALHWPHPVPSGVQNPLNSHEL